MKAPRWHPGLDVYAEVQKIVAQTFAEPTSRLTPKTHFVHDLSASLGFAETIMACEEFFGLHIPDVEAYPLETIGLLAAYVERRLAPDTGVWPPPPKRHLA